jgi:flagellar P-ring protein precursor FlgI
MIMKHFASNKRLIIVSLFLWLSMGISYYSAEAATTRIKDIADIEGVRDNLLVGYGLVVGLNGTGDSLGNSPFTQQSLTAMLERLGVNIRGENLNTGNVAAVMVTATLPPFKNQGSRIDVNIATMGDSSSLQGGTLLVTPLMGADSNVYAVAQGGVITSAISAEGQAGSVTQNIPTAARIPNGGIVEKEIEFDLSQLNNIRLSLRNPDFTTARRMAERINARFGAGTAQAENPASIKVSKTGKYTQQSIVELITDLEQLEILPDQPARIVIDERSGVIVMGKDVSISTVAVAQGDLTVRITEEPQVSQPNAFAENGETVVVPRTNIAVNESGNGEMAVIQGGITLQDLVTSLNSLGISPRDVITILQAIKAAGAMQAEIEVM